MPSQLAVHGSPAVQVAAPNWQAAEAPHASVHPAAPASAEQGLETVGSQVPLAQRSVVVQGVPLCQAPLDEHD
jgi:hypothetical protein